MLSEIMRVRRATLDDVPELSRFGRRVFEQTFAVDNHPDHLRAYLDAAYVEPRQREEVADPGIETLLLENGSTLLAYAQLREGPPGDGVNGAEPIELWRFYVDFPWHGRGVATTLMQAVEESCRRRRADMVWLGVWERNLRAQAFYRKHGFAIVGAQTFMMGRDPQRDLIMAKAVTAEPQSGVDSAKLRE